MSDLPTISDPRNAAFKTQTWNLLNKQDYDLATGLVIAALAESNAASRPIAKQLNGIHGALHVLSDIVRGVESIDALTLDGETMAPIVAGAGNSRVPRWDTTNERWESSLVNIGATGQITPASGNPDLGASFAAWGTAYVQQLTATAASPLNTLGSGTGSPIILLQKSATGTALIQTRQGTSLTTNDKRLNFDTDEVWRFQHRGAGWETAFALTNDGLFQTRTFTVASLPSASDAGCVIYVSDETGGAVLAFSDGTNWRRVTDRAIVS